MANVVKIVLQGVDNASSALRAPIASLEDLAKAADKLKGPVAAAAATAAGAFAAMAVNAAEAMRRTATALTVATGDARKTSREMGFIRDTAIELGLDLQSAAFSYAKLSAATKGTGIEGQATRNIFVGLSQAATALGLDAETTNGAFVAFQQIASKGKVQAEELRGQLGERIPGAFNIAARAMGVTTAELNKMLELGQVASDDFLPKFAAELQKTFGPAAQEGAQSFTANMNRLKTLFNELLVQVGNAMLPRLNELLQWVSNFEKQTGTLVATGQTLVDLFNALVTVGKSLGDIFQALGTHIGYSLAIMEQMFRGNFGQARELFADMTEKMGGHWDSLVNRMTGNDPLKKFQDEIDAINAQAAKMRAEAQEIEKQNQSALAGGSNVEVQSEQARKMVDAISAQYMRLGATKQELVDIEEAEEQDRILATITNEEQKQIALYQVAAIYAEKRAELARQTEQQIKSELEKVEQENAKQNERKVEAERNTILQIQELRNQFRLDSLTGVEREIEAEKQRFVAQLEAINALAIAEDEARVLREESESAHQERLAQIRIDAERRVAQTTAQIRQAQLQAIGSFFGAIATAAAVTAGKQSAVFKAAAIGEALVNTYASAVAAYKAMAGIPVVGPALGAAAAAAATTAGLANVAAIKSTNVRGVAHGGMEYVPSETTYILNRGERVVSNKQNADLTDFLNGNRQAEASPTMIEILLDGEILGRGIGRMSRDGRLTIHAGAVA